MRIEKDTESTSMNRRQFLSAAGVGLASVMLGRSGSAEAAGTVDRPNVIFFFSDTHRWGAMSYTQTPAVQTPFLVQMKTVASPWTAATATFRFARRIAAY